MKQFLFTVLILSLCELCPAQNKYQFTSGLKTITTATDTIVANTIPFQSYELIVINNSASTDTLQWWTDADTTKKNLIPNQEDYRQHIIFSKLFRRAKNSSVTSEAYGN